MQTRVFCLVLAILVVSGLCMAAVPESFSYQGKLTAAGGAPVADGTHQVQFKLYTTATGGSAFWTSTVANVQTSGGVFSTQIGPVAASLVDKPEVHLEVLAGSPLVPLTPRVRLLTVPFALRTGALDLPYTGTATTDDSVFALENRGSGPALSARAGTGLAAEFVGKVRMDELQLMSGIPGMVLACDGNNNVVWQRDGLTFPYEMHVPSTGMTDILKIHGLGPATVGHMIIATDDVQTPAFVADSEGLKGSAALFRVTNDGNPSDAVEASTTGSGSAMKAIAGTGLAAEFVGRTKTTDLQVTNGAAAGKVLTSDASGNATWQSAASYTAGSGLTLSGNQFSISKTGASTGQALTFNGASVGWGNPKASDLTLPFWWTVDYPNVAFWVINTGLGTAGSFLINNDSNMNQALSATSNAASGGAASFRIDNASNPYSAVYAHTTGAGRAGNFVTNNTSNSNPTLYAETNGSGPALKADGGTGLAGEFIGKTKTTDLQVTNGAGAGKVLTSDASGNATWQQVGTGSIGATGASSGQALMYNGTAVAWGNPKAAGLVLPYSDTVSSSSTAFQMTNSGLGSAGFFSLSNSSSGNAALRVDTSGTGDGININCSNSSSNASGIYIAKSGGGAAIAPSALGTGTAISAYTRDGTLGSFLVDSTTNANTALTLTHKGTGVGAKFIINNTANNSAGLYAETNGTANAIQGEAVGNNSSAGYFNLSSSTSAKDTLVAFNSGSGAAIRARAWGTGAGIWAYTTGATGYGGKFEILNGSNPGEALYTNTTGTGKSAHFRIDNTSNNSAAMYAETNGIANAIEGKASGNGSAGYFHVDSSASTKAGIYVFNGGSGAAVEGHAALSGWAAKFYGDGSTSNGVYISAPSGRVGLQVASGSKAAVVATSDGARLMYAEEAAEVWFTDYGFGKLQQGRVTVTIDPKFAETVTLTEPYHVFVQLNDPESEGVAVTNKSATGFDVIELRHGTSNAEFSYRIVAKRKGYESERMKRSPSADNDPNLFPGR